MTVAVATTVVVEMLVGTLVVVEAITDKQPHADERGLPSAYLERHGGLAWPGLCFKARLSLYTVVYTPVQSSRGTVDVTVVAPEVIVLMTVDVVVLSNFSQRYRGLALQPLYLRCFGDHWNCCIYSISLGTEQ